MNMAKLKDFYNKYSIVFVMVIGVGGIFLTVQQCWNERNERITSALADAVESRQIILRFYKGDNAYLEEQLSAISGYGIDKMSIEKISSKIKFTKQFAERVEKELKDLE